MSVPEDLRGVDAADTCSAHAAKLARTVFACMDAFPFHTCLGVALSAAGVDVLGLNAKEMFDALGLPFVEGNDDLAWRVLRDRVDAINVVAIRKLASGRRSRRHPLAASEALSAKLLSSLEKQLRSPAASLDLVQTAFELLVGKQYVGKEQTEMGEPGR